MTRAGLSSGKEFILGVFEWIANAYRQPREELDRIIVNTTGEAKLIAECARDGVHVIVLDKDGQDAIRNTHHQGSPAPIESLLSIRKMAKRAGLFVSRDRIKIDGLAGGYNKYFISTSRELAEMDPGDLVKFARAERRTSSLR
jgi:hypothetical protein